MTITEGCIVEARFMPGNHHDGHTLADALVMIEVLTDTRPTQAVDIAATA